MRRPKKEDERARSSQPVPIPSRAADPLRYGAELLISAEDQGVQLVQADPATASVAIWATL